MKKLKIATQIGLLVAALSFIFFGEMAQAKEIKKETAENGKVAAMKPVLLTPVVTEDYAVYQYPAFITIAFNN